MNSTEKRGPPHDPHLLICQVIEMGADFSGPAEDIIFSWLLSLTQDIDPADAANLLLDEHDLRQGEPPPGPIGRLWTLLRQTADLPESRLHRPSRRRHPQN